MQKIRQANHEDLSTSRARQHELARSTEIEQKYGNYGDLQAVLESQQGSRALEPEEAYGTVSSLHAKKKVAERLA